MKKTRARWDIKAAYPDGWAVHVSAGDKHIGRLYPRGGGEWELSRDGCQGRQLVGTCDVRAPRDAARFARWIRRELADAVRKRKRASQP